LFGKKNIVLTQSGDHAILYALGLAKNLGKEKAFIQDQGGWLTYKSYAKKAGLQVFELKTDYGVLMLDEFKKLDNKSVLLVNSLSGYFAEQPMKEIARICKEKNCLLINDASGSIGTELAKIGDIIICSFGKDKPVNLHYGGCIASDEWNWPNDDFDAGRIEALDTELNNLPERIKKLEQLSKQIKKDLAEFDILHKNSRSINVVVRYTTDEQKENIINYCNTKHLQFTLCPRYIRVNEKAVSIEVKRT